MPHTWDATYTVRDTGALVSTGTIRNIPAASSPTIAKVLAAVTSMKTYLNGGIAEYALLDWNETAFANPTITAPVGLNSDKALINFQYVNAGGYLIYDRCVIPNPDVATHFELVSGEGYRMLDASKTTLSGLLSTLTGLTIVVTEGKLITQTGRHGKRNHCVMFMDHSENLCPMTLPLATADAALATFAGAMDTNGFSRSRVYSSVFLTKSIVQPDPSTGIGLAAVDADNPDFTSVEKRAMLKLRYLVGVKKHFMSVILPSVRSAACQETAKKKNAWRFSPGNGDTIALAVTSLFAPSRTLRYQGSRIYTTNLDTQ